MNITNACRPTPDEEEWHWCDKKGARSWGRAPLAGLRREGNPAGADKQPSRGLGGNVAVAHV